MKEKEFGRKANTLENGLKRKGEGKNVEDKGRRTKTA